MMASPLHTCFYAGSFTTHYKGSILAMNHALAFTLVAFVLGLVWCDERLVQLFLYWDHVGNAPCLTNLPGLDKITVIPVGCRILDAFNM